MVVVVFGGPVNDFTTHIALVDEGDFGCGSTAEQGEARGNSLGE
jgi:hypothetical protein